MKAKLQKRWSEAKAWWPNFFRSEEEFWAAQEVTQPTTQPTTADYPMKREDKQFVELPKVLPFPPLSTTARGLLDAMDDPSKLQSVDLSTMPSVQDAFQKLFELEEAATCKVGRGDTVLHLQSTQPGTTKPPSRLVYNPDSDIAVGHFVLLRVEKAESSGERGWDIAEVTHCQDKEDVLQVSVAQDGVVYEGAHLVNTCHLVRRSRSKNLPTAHTHTHTHTHSSHYAVFNRDRRSGDDNFIDDFVQIFDRDRLVV